MIEPVAWGITCDGVFQNDGTYGYAEGAERFAQVQNQRFGGACQWKHVPLTHIPPGYAIVPVEPTDEWITKMRAGTIEPQGMDAQAKIIQRLRDQYRKFITAAKGE